MRREETGVPVGNWSARRKPSKSGRDRLKLNPKTVFVIEVKGVIDVHYAILPFPGKASAEHSFIAFEGTNDSCQRSNVLISFNKFLQLSLVTFSEMQKEPT